MNDATDKLMELVESMGEGDRLISVNGVNTVECIHTDYDDKPVAWTLQGRGAWRDFDESGPLADVMAEISPDWKPLE